MIIRDSFFSKQKQRSNTAVFSIRPILDPKKGRLIDNEDTHSIIMQDENNEQRMVSMFAINNAIPVKFNSFNNCLNSISDLQTMEKIINPLCETDILTDQILRNTEIIIQRKILNLSEQERFPQLQNDDHDRKLIKQIQETCKLQESFRFDVPNKLRSVSSKKNMMKNLTQMQDSMEQEKELYDRQQVVLEKFYLNSLQNSGIIMSEKLQKLIIDKPIQHQDQGLTTKDARTLELFSQLGDDKKHQVLLEQALLKDFFLQDKKDLTNKIMGQNNKPKPYKKQGPSEYGQSKVELEKWLVLHQSNQVRLKIRGIEELGKSTHRNYYSQQHDEGKKRKSEERQNNMANITQRSNQYRINIVRQFIKNDLQLKKKENLQVIDYLMDFNPKMVPHELKNQIYKPKMKIPTEQDQRSKSSLVPPKKNHKVVLEQDRIIQILRKCFFRYSNKDEADFTRIYRELDQVKLFEFLKLLNVSPGIVEIHFIQDILSKLMKNKQLKILNFGEFVELIRKVAFLYSTSTNPTKFAKKRRQNILDVSALQQVVEETISADQGQIIDAALKNIEHNNDRKTQEEIIDHKSALNLFYYEALHNHENNMLEPLELEIRQARYMKDFLIKFDPILKELFTFSFQLKGIQGIIPENSYLKFDDIFELLWRIDLFPRLIAKSTVRYFFYYMLNNNEGLDYTYFCHFFNIIGLSIMRSQQNRVQLISQVVKEKKSQILNHMLAYFRALDRMSKSSLSLMAELGLFYLDPAFLDSGSLPEKFRRILLEQNKLQS